MSKNWFKTRRMGNRVYGVVATGFDENIGKDDEEKFEVYLTAMTGSNIRESANKLVDLLNKAVDEYYGRKDGQGH